MKRIYDVMKEMKTDPASFFKQVARGEIAIIIESAAGDQLNPPLEFWRHVLLDNDNEEAIPTHSHFKTLDVMGFANQKLKITESALIFVANGDAMSVVKRIALFFSNQIPGSHYNPLRTLNISNIYTDYAPAQANHSPADTMQVEQPKHQAIQAKGGYAAKINQVIIDFEQSAEFIKHGKGTQQGLVGDWLGSKGFDRDEQRVIKVLISEHYGLTTSRKLR